VIRRTARSAGGSHANALPARVTLTTYGDPCTAGAPAVEGRDQAGDVTYRRDHVDAVPHYRWYMNHQHRLHTLVSHVRGPGEPVTFGGSRIAEAVPVAVGEGGNMPVYFEAMSYAGTLTITVIVDPENLPESAELVDALHAERAQVKHA
jgi:hypothetical protein